MTKETFTCHNWRLRIEDYGLGDPAMLYMKYVTKYIFGVLLKWKTVILKDESTSAVEEVSDEEIIWKLAWKGGQ